MLKIDNTLGYLGPPGTFSEQAALDYWSERKNIIPFKSIKLILEGIKKEYIQAGIIPIENSLEGSVTISMDLLFEQSILEIVDEYVLPVRHFLLASPGVKINNITELFSHIQAIRQSGIYIEKYLSDVKINYTTSTAFAAKQVQGKLNRAMIGSNRISSLYGLHILARDIQDHVKNYTRFLIIAKKNGKRILSKPGKQYKTSVICTPKINRSGVLYEILGEFAKENINLTRIESRPTKKQLGEYLFYIDLEGSVESQRVRRALNHIKLKSGFFKILGSYPSASFKEGRSEYVKRKDPKKYG